MRQGRYKSKRLKPSTSLKKREKPPDPKTATLRVAGATSKISGTNATKKKPRGQCAACHGVLNVASMVLGRDASGESGRCAAHVESCLARAGSGQRRTGVGLSVVVFEERGTG